MFFSFFASLIQNIYTPIIPKLHDSFQVSLFWINFTVGGFIFIVAIMQILLGKNIDSKNSKRTLLVGLGIVIISSFICSITNNFIIFVVSRLLQAIGCGIIPLVTLTLLAQLTTNNERASVMANYQIFLSCAPALAPILGSVLGAKWNYFGIFVFLLVVSILLFIVLYLIDIPDAIKAVAQSNVDLSGKNYLTDKVFITLVFLGFLVFFTYFSILVYLPILLSNSYSIAPSMIGILFLPITTSVIIGSIVYKKISKVKDSMTILRNTVITFAIFTLSFGLMHYLNLIVLSLIIFALGFLVGIVPALLSTLISQRYENIKGKVLGIFNFIRYLGMTFGSITIGLISQQYMLFYFSFIFIVMLTIFLYIKTVHFNQAMTDIYHL
ncbi:MFS transporter [Staphylococcus pseudintermedius]|uniref:MFS transporter n=1 Tax=Staphylococcus pseudintermedius TaxID=283734 RepID=UPI001936D5C8|nr:MFS transporter [Staphylococcus pseudintermedius]QQJ55230.1 MFS transporter [Staphylococcus pseudintermedius]QQJ62607.1 MFS transporter [Staphylococcus pseudintermedius]